MCLPNSRWADVGLGVSEKGTTVTPQVWRPRCPRWRRGRPGRNQADFDGCSWDFIHSRVTHFLPLHTYCIGPLFSFPAHSDDLFCEFNRPFFYQRCYRRTNTGVAHNTNYGSAALMYQGHGWQTWLHWFSPLPASLNRVYCVMNHILFHFLRFPDMFIWR